MYQKSFGGRAGRQDLFWRILRLKLFTYSHLHDDKLVFLLLSLDVKMAISINNPAAEMQKLVVKISGIKRATPVGQSRPSLPRMSAVCSCSSSQLNCGSCWRVVRCHP